MWYNTKGQKCPLKGHNYEFLPLIFPNLTHLKYKLLPKRHVVLKVLREF